MRKISKKLVVGAAATAIVAAGAGVAFAYWSATGTGTGTGTTGAGTNDLSAVSAAANGLVPGSSTEVAFTVSNGNSHSSEHFSNVTYAVNPSNTDCKGSWFTITGLPTDTTVDAGGTSVSTITVAFADSAESQDACKDNTLDISYVIH